MSERFQDDDIEFDFFEDADTHEQSPPDWLDDEQEASREEPRPPRRQAGPGGGGGAGGLSPRGRLIALVVGAVVLAILLVFFILSCTGDDKRDIYGSYMDDMTEIGRAHV